MKKLLILFMAVISVQLGAQNLEHYKKIVLTSSMRHPN